MKILFVVIYVLKGCLVRTRGLPIHNSRENPLYKFTAIPIAAIGSLFARISNEIHGADKSTHIDRLAQCFHDMGRQVTLASESGGTMEQRVQEIGLDAALPKDLQQPELTVWFDLPAQVAAQRLASARVPDKFEAQPQAFFEQVSQGYAMRCAAAPQRFVRINADQPPESVWTDVETALRGRGLLQ